MDYKEKRRHGTHDFPFEIYENRFDNGLNLNTHYHREFEIIFIKNGNGTAYIADECYDVKNGDILFVNSGYLHGIVGADEKTSEFVSIVFAPEFLGNLDIVASKYIIPILNKSVYIPTYIKGNAEFVDSIFEICRSRSENFSELKIKSLMFKIWDLLISKSTPVHGNIKENNLEEIKVVIDYIKNNFQNKITLFDLAKLTNMSRVYFCEKFTKIAGISPIEYLIRVRIENSCKLLSETDTGIGDIAMECGFSGFSYYSEIFKKIMGCTPRDYRKRHIK